MALFYESNEKTQIPAFENLTDVDLDQNTLANGQVPVYNATTRKWENAVVDVANKFNSDNVATVETGNTASQSYAVGSHLIWNGIYYVVTQAIAQGDILSVGANINRAYIGDELNNRKLSKLIYSGEGNKGTLSTVESQLNTLQTRLINNYTAEQIQRVKLKIYNFYSEEWYGCREYTCSGIAYNSNNNIGIITFSGVFPYHIGYNQDSAKIIGQQVELKGYVVWRNKSISFATTPVTSSDTTKPDFSNGYIEAYIDDCYIF